MPRKTRHPEYTTATLVLPGVFNPDSFSPTALAEQKAISRKDATIAKFRTLAPGTVVHFELLWGEIFVTTDRIQVSTTEAPYVRICDFVVKALSDQASEPLVHAFGVNVESHFDLGSVKARDEIGVKLAPPEAWGAWGRGMRATYSASPEKHGGVFRLQMRMPFAEDDIAGWLDVTIGPSERIANSTGIFFRTNHHHRISRTALSSDASKNDKRPVMSDSRLLLAELARRFDGSVMNAEKIFHDVIGD